MSKDKLAPCIYYQSYHQCTKGKEAEQYKLCQHCDKYEPRKGFKVIDKRKEERDKYYE